MNLKLGKKPASAPRVRHMRDLVGLTTERPPAVPPIPASVDWTNRVTRPWGMLDNDTIGDCTVAAVGHAALCWTSVAGDPRAMTDAEAIAGYEAFGYRPGAPSSDGGADVQDVLAHWTAPGFSCGGEPDTLAGFAYLDPRDHDAVKSGIAWLGCVYVGVMLPLAMQGASWWSVPNGAPDGLGPDWAPGSWGGHAIVAVGYDEKGVTVITWGAPLRVSWAFWDAYVDEAYGLLDRDFAAAAIPAETWPRLEADMAALRMAA